MQRIRLLVRAFFGFSRGETNAFLILLPLMVAILFSEPVYRHWQSRSTQDYSKDQQYLDSLVASLTFVETDSINKSKNRQSLAIKFYSFDPNILPEDKFIQLGLSPFLASRIVRYREKGGTFRKKEDVSKIYGMDSVWFRNAMPWITIATELPRPQNSKPTERKIVVPENFDINLADSTQLMKVYGIGPALSKRIETFRDRLGGFISMEQLREVYGLDSVVVNAVKKRFFISENFEPRKINLNTLNPETIRHPYLRRREANAITAYRRQHGNLTSTDQLKEIKILTPEWIEKIRPYISLE